MNGVEILSSTQVASEFAFNEHVFWISFGVTFGIVVLISILHIIIYRTDWLCTVLFCLIFGIMFGTIIGFMLGDTITEPSAYETHYTVTVSDEVKFTDFMNKYEILGQEGKIYTVKERE